ncbi:MAG: TonB-dependent receptor [Bacteroidales bacterium]|nr:TonB-dependent receptor [Bacteroidales bacterium]
MEKKRIIWLVLMFFYGVINASAFQDRPFVRGKVTDSEGNPLPGATVAVENTFIGTSTGVDGSYAVYGLAKGASYTVTYSFIGYETVSETVEWQEDAVKNVTLPVRRYLTDEVTVVATRAGGLAPLAYTAVKAEELRKMNTAFDLPYLLSLTPSFVETSESGNGIGYTGLRIRGTDGNRINVTIDGIPLNDAESQQVFWIDLPDIASSVDNIQVQRGVGTSSNGAGAFGATISMQTANTGDKPFAEISSSAGSFNTFKNVVSAGTGLINNRLAFQMRYSDISSDGYVMRTGSKHKSWFMSGTYKTAKSLLKANIIMGEQHTGIGWWGLPKDSLNADRRYNPAGEYTDEAGAKQYYNNESDNYIQNHYHLIYSRKLSNAMTLNTALHYTDGSGYYEEYGEDQSYSDYGLLPVLPTLTETDLVKRKWMDNDFYGMVFSLRYHRNNLEAIIGGGTNQYLGDHFGRIIWMKEAGLTPKDYQWYFNDSRKGEASLYGKVNLSLTGATSVFGDLQYRTISYRMRGFDDDFKDIGQQHGYSFLNPKAGIFHSVSANQDLWLSLSVANREPTRTDFKEAAGDATATPKPETLYDAELGYNLRNENSLASVNLYGMYYSNQLVPTGELSDVGYSIKTNVDRSYRIGMEISAGVKPFRFMDWNMNLTLSRNKILDYVEYYTDSNTSDWSSEYKNKKLGTVDIAYSPSVIINNTLSFHMAKNLELSFISKFVGKQYFDNTMSDERSIDPYFVNNLQVAFTPKIKHTDNVELQFMVNNIFNEKYESNAYGGTWYEDGVENTWSYYFPQAGTSFMSRIVVRF